MIVIRAVTLIDQLLMIIIHIVGYSQFVVVFVAGSFWVKRFASGLVLVLAVASTHSSSCTNVDVFEVDWYNASK